MYEDALEAYRDKNVTITGGGGYIGSLLAQALNGQCKSLRITSRSPIGSSPTNSISGLQSELLSAKDWIEITTDTDILFHLAGNTSIPYAKENPKDSFSGEILPLIGLDAAIRAGSDLCTVVHASTATIYGMPARKLVTEAVFPKPLSLYDVQKYQAETYLQYIAATSNVNCISLRLANVFGPSLVPSGSRDRGILNMMINKILQNENITLFGDGEFIRDYIYITDVVNAFLLAGVKLTESDCFNVSTGIGTTIKEAVGLALDSIADSTSEVTFQPWPSTSSPIDRRNFIGDCSKLVSKTGWSPQVTIEQGVKRTISTFQQLGSQ